MQADEFHWNNSKKKETRKKQLIPLETHLFNAPFPQDLLIASCGIGVFSLAASLWKFFTFPGTMFSCIFIFRFEELLSVFFSFFFPSLRYFPHLSHFHVHVVIIREI